MLIARSTTLAALLLLPGLLAGAALSDAPPMTDVSDPAGDERASVAGVALPPQAGCHDPAIDWTGLRIETTSETLRITATFADLAAQPRCDRTGDFTRRYINAFLYLKDPANDNYLEIDVPHRGTFGFIEGSIDGDWFQADATVTRDGNSITLETPLTTEWAYHSDTETWGTADMRGHTFTQNSALAHSIIGDTRAPTLTFSDMIDVGDVQL